MTSCSQPSLVQLWGGPASGEEEETASESSEQVQVQSLASAALSLPQPGPPQKTPAPNLMPQAGYSFVVQAEEKPCRAVSSRALCFGAVLALVIGLGMGLGFWRSLRAPAWHGRGTSTNFSQRVLQRCSSYSRGSGPELG